MQAPGPVKTLAILWGIAAVILVGGILLARQKIELRIDRDRAPLREFAAETQSRLQRLEDLYQDHLMRLGMEVVPSALETGHAGEETAGILQVSLLAPGKSGVQPYHYIVRPSAGETLPLPAFAVDSSGRGLDPEALVLLDEARLFSRESGWIDEPGKPLMFTVKRFATEVAVIAVSRPAVAESIGTWLRAWADKSFEPVRVAGGPDQLRSDGVTLARVGLLPSGPPDLILPLRSRFGSFEIASWDLRKPVVRYHPATLTVSVTLAILTAILGGLVFFAQRRDHAIAAQRVSFVNRVSHELRTPLTNILLNIDLAAELAEDAPGESKGRLELVRTEARRLGRLIDNVLTFARVEAGKREVGSGTCVPAEVVTAVIDQFLPSFQCRGLTIHREEENAAASCVLDADALSQILANLLSNVEKYVPGGVVGISTRVADGELTVRVSDQGPGVPREAAERIFRPFERLHSAVNEGVSGTGLGLAISRDLAGQLGGTLSLLPAVAGHGSCFELRIPAPRAHPL